MERRKFIQTGALGSVMLGGLFSLNNSYKKSELQSINEKARDIPIAGEYDVIVSGGGPAGVMAAISASRSGARTLLLEVKGCIGGVWTSGLLAWILDNANKSGLMRELESRLIKTGGKSSIDTGQNIAFDVEKMKLVLEIMCNEAGVDILLHSRVVSAVKNENNKLTHIITESKSFRQAWSGKVFIDTTGDGDLAALCGCGFDFGSEEDGSFQPMSLLALISGVEFSEIEKFVRWAGDKGSVSKKRLLEEMGRANISPSYASPSIFPLDKDLFMIMTNHEYGFKGTNAKEVTKATMEARMELHKIISSLKSLGKPWTNLRLIATADQIGVREGRRIHGLYKITSQDLINGAKFTDAVCHVTFGIDVHSVNIEKETKGIRNKIISKPYDIPLRALIAKDVEGLMMAGRCISGDFFAHASYRVTGNAVPMGEAAGKVAAIAAKNNRLPREVKWSEVQ